MKLSRYFLLSLLPFYLTADPLLCGYYSNKAQYRPGAGSCLPHNLNPILAKIDILHYGFLLVDAQGATRPVGPTNDSQIHFSEWNDEAFLKELREKNPSLKIIVTIHNPAIKDADKQKAFIDSVIDLCHRFDLQGVDIQCDNEIYSSLLKDLRSKAPKDFIIALSPLASPASWAETAPYVSFFVVPSENMIKDLMQEGIPAEKIVMSLSSYGKAPASYQGYYTREPGSLAYFEIIDGLERGLIKESDVSYDDPEKAYNKGLWAAEMHLKGVALNSLDADSFMDPLAPFALTDALSEGLKQ